MSCIRAAQLIYGTVEAELSPARRAGHQVLLKTSGEISDGEELEIEARLFYPARSAPAIKYLFFPIAGDRHVLARIAPLPARDAFGRGGAFLAHALVANADALRAVENNPFPIFHSFSFPATPEEALTRADGAPGEIAPATIEVRPAPVAEIDDAQAEWWPLMLTALRGRQTLAQHEGLALAGPSDRIFSLLESLFSLLPAEARRWCSFDTCFSGGNLVRTPYWAAGGNAGDFRSPEWMVYDLQENRFRRPMDSNPATPSEHWLHREWDSGKPLRDVARAVGSQFALAGWLDGGSLPEIVASDDDIRQFLTAEPTALERRLAAILSERIGVRLGERLAARAARWLLSSETLRPHMSDQLQQAPLQAWLLDLVSATERPSAADLEALQNWIGERSEPMPALQMRIHRWAGEWAELSLDAAALSDQEFADFASWALATVNLRTRPALYLDRQTAALALRAELAEDDADARGILSALCGTLSAPAPIANDMSLFDRFRRPRSRSLEESGWAACRISPQRLRCLLDLLTAQSTPHER